MLSQPVRMLCIINIERTSAERPYLRGPHLPQYYQRVFLQQNSCIQFGCLYRCLFFPICSGLGGAPRTDPITRTDPASKNNILSTNSVFCSSGNVTPRRAVQLGLAVIMFNAEPPCFPRLTMI